MDLLSILQSPSLGGAKYARKRIADTGADAAASGSAAEEEVTVAAHGQGEPRTSSPATAKRGGIRLQRQGGKTRRLNPKEIADMNLVTFQTKPSTGGAYVIPVNGACDHASPLIIDFADYG